MSRIKSGASGLIESKLNLVIALLNPTLGAFSYAKPMFVTEKSYFLSDIPKKLNTALESYGG
jgi:hypothetical protein